MSVLFNQITTISCYFYKLQRKGNIYNAVINPLNTGCFNRIVCSVVKGNGSHVNLKLTEQGYPVSESTGGSNSCEVTLFWCVGYKRDSHVECEVYFDLVLVYQK